MQTKEKRKKKKEKKEKNPVRSWQYLENKFLDISMSKCANAIKWKQLSNTNKSGWEISPNFWSGNVEFVFHAGRDVINSHH